MRLKNRRNIGGSLSPDPQEIALRLISQVCAEWEQRDREASDRVRIVLFLTGNVSILSSISDVLSDCLLTQDRFSVHSWLFTRVNKSTTDTHNTDSTLWGTF